MACRYFMRLAYNGAPFHGWQTQPNAVSVQETLEKAMSMVMRMPLAITGAGRTDTGVNARTMVAHFDVEDMDSGMFSSQIQHVIEQAPDFIIVLSGDALGKCTDSFDWMRLEIEWALGSGKNIIPVFTRDFTWPETLPKEIAAIKFYHGITIRNDTFEQSAGQIEQLLASGRAAGGKKDYLENKGPELR